MCLCFFAECYTTKSLWVYSEKRQCLETLMQDGRNGDDGKKIGGNCNFYYQAPVVQKLDKAIVPSTPFEQLGPGFFSKLFSCSDQGHCLTNLSGIFKFKQILYTKWFLVVARNWHHFIKCSIVKHFPPCPKAYKSSSTALHAFSLVAS